MVGDAAAAEMNCLLREECDEECQEQFPVFEVIEICEAQGGLVQRKTTKYKYFLHGQARNPRELPPTNYHRLFTTNYFHVAMN